MKRGVVESFVRRVFTDSDFREKVATQGERAIETEDLSPAERYALSKFALRVAGAGGAVPDMPLYRDALIWE